MLAKLNGVVMRRRPVLEGENQFVPGAVEGSHAAIVLGPHDQVLEFGEDGACRDHLAHVAPVHADEVDRAFGAEPDQVLERGPEEAGKLGGAHLA